VPLLAGISDFFQTIQVLVGQFPGKPLYHYRSGHKIFSVPAFNKVGLENNLLPGDLACVDKVDKFLPEIVGCADRGGVELLGAEFFCKGAELKGGILVFDSFYHRINKYTK
jgi:hypothetical protein